MRFHKVIDIDGNINIIDSKIQFCWIIDSHRRGFDTDNILVTHNYANDTDTYYGLLRDFNAYELTLEEMKDWFRDWCPDDSTHTILYNTILNNEKLLKSFVAYYNGPDGYFAEEIYEGEEKK